MNGHSGGYKRAIDQNWGRMAKVGFFCQKPRFQAPPKKLTSWDSPCSCHDRKKLFKEISCLFPNNYQSLKKFWAIFWVKTHFWPKKHFSVECKNVRFSVIPARIGSVVILCHFLMAQTVSPIFIENGPKLRVLIPLS